MRVALAHNEALFNGGGGVHIQTGLVTLNSCEIHHNQALFGAGIDVSQAGAIVTIMSCQIHSNVAHLDASVLGWMDSCPDNSCDDNHGGGLYGQGGTLKLGDGTAFFNNSAAGLGDNLPLPGSTIFYVFPVPAGHWLPNGECRVYRDPCPGASAPPVLLRAGAHPLPGGAEVALLDSQGALVAHVLHA